MGGLRGAETALGTTNKTCSPKKMSGRYAVRAVLDAATLLTLGRSDGEGPFSSDSISVGVKERVRVSWRVS